MNLMSKRELAKFAIKIGKGLIGNGKYELTPDGEIPPEVRANVGFAHMSRELGVPYEKLEEYIKAILSKDTSQAHHERVVILATEILDKIIDHMFIPLLRTKINAFKEELGGDEQDLARFILSLHVGAFTKAYPSA